MYFNIYFFIYITLYIYPYFRMWEEPEDFLDLEHPVLMDVPATSTTLGLLISNYCTTSRAYTVRDIVSESDSSLYSLVGLVETSTYVPHSTEKPWWFLPSTTSVLLPVITELPSTVTTPSIWGEEDYSSSWPAAATVPTNNDSESSSEGDPMVVAAVGAAAGLISLVLLLCLLCYK